MLNAFAIDPNRYQFLFDFARALMERGKLEAAIICWRPLPNSPHAGALTSVAQWLIAHTERGQTDVVGDTAAEDARDDR